MAANRIPLVQVNGEQQQLQSGDSLWNGVDNYVSAPGVTGSGNAVKAVSPTLSGTTVAATINATVLTSSGTSVFGGAVIGSGTLFSTLSFLIQPASGDVRFGCRVPGTGNYAQFGFFNPGNAQQAFFGYIGSTFGAPRSDHFEIGTTPGTSIWFRPGDGANEMEFQPGGHGIFNGRVIAGAQVRLKGYTVATLPSPTQGDTAFVTNALNPQFGIAVVGGGSVVTKVFHNGTSWLPDGITAFAAMDDETRARLNLAILR